MERVLWLANRVSAFLLIPLLALHLLDKGGLLSIPHLWLRYLLAVLLLLALLVHGLYGLRSVILEIAPVPRPVRWALDALLALGLFFFFGLGLSGLLYLF